MACTRLEALGVARNGSSRGSAAYARAVWSYFGSTLVMKLAGSDCRPSSPQLGKQHRLQQAAQVIHPRGAAGAALEADDTLHGGGVAEAPLAKGILQVHQFLGQLVELPMPVGMAIDLDPRGAD